MENGKEILKMMEIDEDLGDGLEKKETELKYKANMDFSIAKMKSLEKCIKDAKEKIKKHQELICIWQKKVSMIRRTFNIGFNNASNPFRNGPKID